MHPIARAARPASSIASTVPGPETPSLLTLGPRGRPRAAVVIAHGGRSQSTARDSNLRTPALRMLPFLLDLARSGRRLGLASAQLRYRVVGYNEGDPVADVEWALDRVAERYDVPVCLLGHSMGARAALRAAGHPSVVSVVALAPWCPPAEPVEQLQGRTVAIAHGVRDRITDPARSLDFARRAHPAAGRLARFELRGTGHTMLQRLPAWQSLARRLTLGTLGVRPLEDQLAAAFALPADRAVRISQ
jgi:pimeloyl-ACP methyl ester carboxylesterase